MSRILVLADSGFGKSTSLGNIPQLNIKGLAPKETLIIQATKKGLPLPGWRKNYLDFKADPTKNNYLVSNVISDIIKTLDYVIKSRPDIKNVVLDDFNYIMQDYYMKNAKKRGYDTFQTIGYEIGLLFEKIDELHDADKNIIVMAHYEVEVTGGVIRFKLKTVGKMVDQYLTPEGKFEIVLMGKEVFDDTNNKVEKYFVTGFDGKYKAKTPYGMFEDLYIPNDMGYVLEKAHEYENAV